MDSKKPIKSYADLDVYCATYGSAITVITQLLPMLPASEKFDLKDQLSRSGKAVPRLIAEGYAKRHQKAGFRKYLGDAMGECNETVVGINMCRDIYKIDTELCNKLADVYDKAGRQLYNLSAAWSGFKDDRRNHPTIRASLPQAD